LGEIQRFGIFATKTALLAVFPEILFQVLLKLLTNAFFVSKILSAVIALHICNQNTSSLRRAMNAIIKYEKS